MPAFNNLAAPRLFSAAIAFIAAITALAGIATVARAATNTPIALTGFNRDVIIENTASGPPYNNYAQNFNAGEQTCFFQTNLPGVSGGLPLNGSFVNTNDGTLYQLQPYTANNVLDLDSDTGQTNGTLFLLTPKVYDTVAIIANSGSASSANSGTLTLHFNDGTTYNTNYYAPDWFNNNSGSLYTVALQGFQRINLSGGANGAPSNPRFYQTSITLSNIPAISGKRLSSLTFGQASGANSTGIYAVSGATNASQTPLTYTPATLGNFSASSIQTTAATLNGQVLSTGNDAPVVTLFYGTSNGGTNAAAWSNSVSAGWQTGSFSAPVSGLALNTTYYFTAQAVNAGGTSWFTPAATFKTLAPTRAAVVNLAASSILANSASLNGQVTSTGGDTPTITIYYGPANGGTNAAAWANSINAGLQSSSFTRGVFNLSPSTTYYFTVEAANAGGTSWAAPSLSFTTVASNPPPPVVAVLTQHNDNNRSGENLNETVLNTSNVNTNTFGLLYTRPVDDQIYAQPLVVTNVTIPGHGTHNILYICSMNDSVYAYDADDPTVINPYWQTNLVPSGETIVQNVDMTGACGGNYHDFSGDIGIVGTPVIDPNSKTMYFVARTLQNGTNFIQRLYALDITTGTNRVSPVVISGTFSGVSWDPQKNNQRSALALANGNIFIAWSSHCDWGPYHGWVMEYNASTLAQVATYCDTPTGSDGGIWMSGQGPAVDTNGNIFISTGNGTTDSSGTVNRAMSFLKLSGANLSVLSWFSPYNYNYLNGGDWDLGAGGVMLIPGTTLAIGGGKSSSTVAAHLYVVQRDNMGGLSGSTTADTNIVQSIPVTPTGVGFNHIHGAPVWWDGPDGSYTYVWGESDHLHQYKFDKANGVFFTPAYAQSPTPAWVNGMTGGMLAISANGTNAGTGILWGSHQFTGDANQSVRPGIVHAYDAQNVTNELWNSEQFSARDSIGLYAKFVPPTVANGKVYMATFSGRVNVYGLLPATAPQIYANPSSSTRFTGDTVAFAVAAGGAKPLSFQWYFNGTTAIPGATNASYTITNLQYSQAGTYTCAISNSLGKTSTTSSVLTVLTSPTISYSQTVIGDHPIAYWRLDETNGTVAHDTVGGHDGQYNNANLGAAGYNANDPDTAVEFGTLSATGSYVGGINGIDFSTFANNAAFSVEAWVNSEGYTEQSSAGILAYGYGGGGEQFDLDCGGGGNAFRFSVRDAINVAHNASGNVVADGSWQHVVGVCNEPAGLVSLYVNGVLNATANISGGIQMGTVPVSIGSRESGYNDTNFTLNFQGIIDEVAIYNYPLSAAQVENHYLVGSNPVATLYLENLAGNNILIWSPGTLQSATSAAGPYTDIAGATAPYTLVPTAGAKFYRVRVK